MPRKARIPEAPRPKAAAKRRSKLAKEHSISAEEEAEIQEAFTLFAQQGEDDDNNHNDGEPTLPIADLRRCLVALNAPPKDRTELNELLETVDPEQTGWVGYERFVAIAALKLRAKDDDPAEAREEVARAYALFTKGEGQRAITLADLRRVARELREDVPEPVLKDMLREATGGGLGGVGMEEFEGVMRRAGVFG